VGIFIAENAEFAIAGAILDARENRSGASDKARARGSGEREKPVFCESQILTSSAGRRGILIGRFTFNYREFGVTQKKQISETK